MDAITNIGIFVLLIFTFLGCGDHDHGHAHGEQTHLEEACSHMTDGTMKELVAAASSSEATVTSTDDWNDTRVEIDLDGIADDAPGFVLYRVDQTALYSVFTASGVVVTVDGIESVSITSFDECETIGAIHTFDLEAGERVIGVSSTQRPIALVIEKVTGSEHSHD